MHYIRFLKPPRVVRTGAAGPASLVAKITVTTDLGEAFLAADIGLLVLLEVDEGDGKGRALQVGKGLGKEYSWKGRNGMRALEVAIPVPVSKGKKAGRALKMLVRPIDQQYAVDNFGAVLEPRGRDGDGGGVVAVRSMDVYSQPSGIGLAERVFTHGSVELSIWEETGESIARHIWDAGLVLSSYLACLSSQETKQLPKLPALQQALARTNLNVLELGAGCGIVGITLSQFFNANLSQVILTDLPEASDILTQNLSPPTLCHSSPPTHQVLDWSSPLPPNIAATKWDIVLVADCTYNPDVVPDLVATLRSIAEQNSDVLVLLAMKVRHESEMVFFELMRDAGWVVRERARVEMPVLGGEEQEIEVFVFGMRGEVSDKSK